MSTDQFQPKTFTVSAFDSCPPAFRHPDPWALQHTWFKLISPSAHHQGLHVSLSMIRSFQTGVLYLGNIKDIGTIAIKDFHKLLHTAWYNKDKWPDKNMNYNTYPLKYVQPFCQGLWYAGDRIFMSSVVLTKCYKWEWDRRNKRIK